tara:strand:+ start:4142 stop:4750 length:609 start_codon:yes stop_codon:yes gene_type:complete
MRIQLKKLNLIRKCFILGSITTFSYLVAFTASSQEQADVGADANFSETTTMISVIQGIDFGDFTFTQNDIGGIIQMSVTTGTIVMNVSNYIPQGSSHYGIVNYTIDAGDYVVTCDDDAYLALEGDTDLSNRIPIARVYYQRGSKTRICGAGENPRTYTSTGAPQTIYIAGWIDVKPGADAIPGFYSTSNSLGEPITFTFTII